MHEEVENENRTQKCSAQINVEIGSGARAQSMTVESTGCGFDPNSMK